jgi:GNAT superfamily N-acetyltransferase
VAEPVGAGAGLHAILCAPIRAWVALEDGRAVGFVTVLSDGVYSAYLPLLEVLPAWRGQGVGRALVTRALVTRALEGLAGHYMVDVVCDAAVAPFYERLGFLACGAMARRDHGRQALRRG